MQTDIKRGLVLGIVLLAVIIIVCSQFRDSGKSVGINVDSDRPPLIDPRVTPEPVVPTPSRIASESSQEEAASGTATVVATGAGASTQKTQPAPEPKPSGTASTGTSAPAGNRYHVFKKDETLWTVAEKYYGNGAKWRLIYEANKADLPDPNLIAPETRLVIPPEKPQESPAPATASGSGSAPAAGQRTHVVAEGDSLASIAKKYYGSTKHWRVLLKANETQVPSPDKLRVGTVLIVPPLS